MKRRKLINFNDKYILTDYAIDWIPKHSLFVLDHSELFYIVKLEKYKAVILVGLDNTFDIAGTTPKTIILSNWRQKRIIKHLLKTGFLRLKSIEPFEEFDKKVKLKNSGILVDDIERKNIVDITAYNDIKYDDDINTIMEEPNV